MDVSKKVKIEDWRIVFKPEDIAYVIGHKIYPEKFFQEIMKTETINEDRKYFDMMEKLFFEGGEIPFNKDLPSEYVESGLFMLRVIMCSYKPKHEHKEKVCGLILKSLCK